MGGVDVALVQGALGLAEEHRHLVANLGRRRVGKCHPVDEGHRSDAQEQHHRGANHPQGPTADGLPTTEQVLGIGAGHGFADRPGARARAFGGPLGGG